MAFPPTTPDEAATRVAGPAPGAPGAAAGTSGLSQPQGLSAWSFDGLDRQEVLAASAPWVGAVLNVLPGLGAGYLYQRRWRAWWLTSLLGALAFGLAALPPVPALAAPQALSLGALLLLAVITAAEAFLAARRARMR